MTQSDEFSFKKGYDQLPKSDYRKVRQEIMDVLKIRTLQSFYQRLNGQIEPKVSEAEAIEAVFAKYGITEVWGER